MVGNDVIDLRDADTRPGATHPRFDERVFRVAERRAIQSHPQPNRLRWTLWAAKESAFKALRKIDDRTIFAPQRFSVTCETVSRCTVLHAGYRVDVSVEHTDDTVHAIATVGAASTRGLMIARIGFLACADVHAEVRRLLLQTLAPQLGVAEQDLAVVRVRRVPHLRVYGRPAGVDISLSHHGRCVAFACAMDRRHSELRGAA